MLLPGGTMDAIRRGLTSYPMNESGSTERTILTEALREPEDIHTLSYDAEDLHENGRLGLIIKVDDPFQRNRMKDEIVKDNPGALITADLPLIDGFAVEISPGSLSRLEDLQRTRGGMKVFVDEKMEIPDPEPADDRSVGRGDDVPAITMGVDKIWKQGITGKGVTIAIVDSGIAPHPDLKDKIIGFYDAVKHRPESYDDDGHGTHVASIAAGTGAASEGKKYMGVAPDARLVGVKVINEWGTSFMSTVIDGIQWVVDNRNKYDIKVMNTSLSSKAQSSYKDDPLAQAVGKAAEAGIIPVTTAGNRGPKANSIGSPGTSPLCITVGNINDRGTKDPADDSMAKNSSIGPTAFDGLAKPDVSAPGVNIMAADNESSGYVMKSGTSMASPFVAGCVALFAQADPDITRQEVQDLLVGTGRKLPSVEPNVQGTGGVIDPPRAMKKLLGK
jgi:subtilisin family serine protease